MRFFKSVLTWLDQITYESSASYISYSGVIQVSLFSKCPSEIPVLAVTQKSDPQFTQHNGNTSIDVSDSRLGFG